MRNKFIISIAVIVLIFISFVNTIWDINDNTDKLLKRYTYQYTENITKKNNDFVKEYLQGKLDVLNTLSKQLTTIDNPTPDNIDRNLLLAMEMAGFKSAYNVDEKGNMFFMGIKGNAASMKAYKTASTTTPSINAPEYCDFCKKDCFVFSVPIQLKDGHNVMIWAFYPVEDLFNIVKENNDSLIEKYTVIDSNGNQIIYGENDKKPAISISEMFQKSELKNGYTLEILQNDLKQDKSGSFELKFRNQDFFVKYIPLGYNDWFTATVLPMKSIKETVDKYKLDIFCIVAILGILLLFCVMFIVLYYNYKIKAEKEINRKYEMITKNINIGILLTEYNPLEKTLRLKYINDAFTCITGFSEQDILHNFKDDYFNMIYKDDIEKALNSYINQISKGDTYKLKYRLITKENDYISVIDSGRIYRNDDGMIENRNIITPAD